MALKIRNPFFKTPVQLDAEDLSPRVIAALTANAQAVGQLAGLVEIRNLLVPADAAKLTRQVFNHICSMNEWQIVNPEDPAA